MVWRALSPSTVSTRRSHYASTGPYQVSEGFRGAPNSWDDEGGGDEPKPVHVGGGGGSTGPISVSVAANPVFHIEGGGNSDDILSQIKAKQSEIAEVLGGAIADQLEDILLNMA